MTIATVDQGTGHIAFLLLAWSAETGRTFTAQRAAHLPRRRRDRETTASPDSWPAWVLAFVADGDAFGPVALTRDIRQLYRLATVDTDGWQRATAGGKEPLFVGSQMPTTPVEC